MTKSYQGEDTSDFVWTEHKGHFRSVHIYKVYVKIQFGAIRHSSLEIAQIDVKSCLCELKIFQLELKKLCLSLGFKSLSNKFKDTRSVRG